MKKILLTIVAISVGGIFLNQRSNSNPIRISKVVLAPDSATKGQPAPGFALKDLAGNTVHLSDYSGKVVILNFFATWCPPCRWEIPTFNDLQKQYADQGVQFLGVATDEEGLPTVKSWLSSHSVGYPVLLKDSAIIANYNVTEALPVTFVIDRKGVLSFSYIGDSTKVDHGLTRFQERLKPIIAN